MSSGDNSNILAARVARETYGVEQVVARIYDPRRAEVYQRLGIPTVATVSWTTGQIMRQILPLGAQDEYRDPSGSVTLAEVHLGQSLARPAVDRARGGVRRPPRLHHPLRRRRCVPDADTVLQDGDLVHALFTQDARERVERVFEDGEDV